MTDHVPGFPALSPATPPDIDRILVAIREEARARGSKTRAGGYPTEISGGGAVHVVSYGLPKPELRHVADFLALPLDTFLSSAYCRILGRDPDASGAAHYQSALLRGSLTRIEVLGRLALSPEGRARGSQVQGLTFAFLLAMAYRVPVAGLLAALAAKVLRLPAHWQDRSTLEATAVASGGWMKR